MTPRIFLNVIKFSLMGALFLSCAFSKPVFSAELSATHSLVNLKRNSSDTNHINLAKSLLESIRAYQKIKSYSSTFYKEETSSGKIDPQEEIFLYFSKPFKIHMKWQNDPKKGLEVFYSRGDNNGKLAIHQPGLLLGLAPLVFLDQDSPWVRQGSASFNIEDAGIGTFLFDFTKAVTHAQKKLKLIVKEVENKFEVTFIDSQKDSIYFAYRVVVGFDEATHLVNSMKLFDWENKLIGNYEYQQIKLNQDADVAFKASAHSSLVKLFNKSLLNKSSANTKTSSNFSKKTQEMAKETQSLSVASQQVLANNSFVFAAAGDLGASVNTSKSLKKLASLSPEFFLALGDLSYNQISPEEAWGDYIKSGIGDLPIELISGNHDQNGMFGGLIENFVKSFPDRLGAKGYYGKQYYLDYPSKAPLARFILVSPGLNFKYGGVFSYKKESSNYKWVSKKIDEARALGIPWVIVGMHKHYFSAGHRSTEVEGDLFNLLIRKKVDLVLQAHEHTYQRSKPLAFGQDCESFFANNYNDACVSDSTVKNDYSKGNGTVVLICGTFGAELGNVDIKKDHEAPYFLKVSAKNYEPTYGFTRYVVSKDKLEAEFIASDGGSFRDHFTISDNNSPATPKVD